MTDQEGGVPDAHRGRASNLSAEDLRLLRRLLDRVALDEQRSKTERRADLPNGHAAFALARAILAARDTRKSEFASAIFGEPAWDMLLNLFVHRDREPLTVTRLAQLSQTPLTTAIRWIEYLEQSRLIARHQHPNDARIVLVELTDQARLRLVSYFDALSGTLQDALLSSAQVKPVTV